MIQREEYEKLWCKEIATKKAQRNDYSSLLWAFDFLITASIKTF